MKPPEDKIAPDDENTSSFFFLTISFRFLSRSNTDISVKFTSARGRFLYLRVPFFFCIPRDDLHYKSWTFLFFSCIVKREFNPIGWPRNILLGWKKNVERKGLESPGNFISGYRWNTDFGASPKSQCTRLGNLQGGVYQRKFNRLLTAQS